MLVTILIMSRFSDLMVPNFEGYCRTLLQNKISKAAENISIMLKYRIFLLSLLVNLKHPFQTSTEAATRIDN